MLTGRHSIINPGGSKDNMSSSSFHHEADNYMLPSTFSPWHGEAESNSSSSLGYSNRQMNTTAADPDPAMHSIDSVASPSPVHSLSANDTNLTSDRRSSSTFHSSQPPEITDVNAKRNTAMFPTHPGAGFAPMSAVYNQGSSPTVAVGNDDCNHDGFLSQIPDPSHFDCYSRQDVYIKRWSGIYVTLLLLSLYSTILSGLWLVVSLYQPRYGRGISTGSGWQLTPSTATLIATLAAKTIELSFVTVFVSVLGQVLTRRAFSRLSRGVTLAELTMRNWVIQPGSLLTHWKGFSYAAPTVLGSLTLTATICALLYTTASDAMVSPKLKRQDWSMNNIQGLVKASYSNPYYVLATCQTPLNKFDTIFSPEACLDILFSGQSYHSLIDFMAEWKQISDNPNVGLSKLEGRPTGKHNLFDNTTMDSSWIETQYGDTEASFDTHKRIINNVTLAIPHPGVYTAARDPINGILQPDELLGLGEYSIRASVVSPTVNVMCVNMNKDELAPLIYTTWPHARTDPTGIPNQTVGVFNWQDDVPQDSPTEWLNRTVVDDIFRWGEQYGRRPPAFPLYPIDYNVVTYVSTSYADSLYLLAKSGNISDYTICELRSWVTPKCSTAFNMSGTSGGYMKAQCEDPDDKNAYERVYPERVAETPNASGDWRNVAAEWRLSINLNAGVQNSNASNARVLTNLILDKPRLNLQLPSIAEAVATLAISTLVAGSQDSTFEPSWTHGEDLMLEKGVYETFHAEMQTQQYASAHTEAWQAIFYPVIILVFILNVLCLLYLFFGTAITYTPFPSSESKKKKKKNKHTSFSSYLPFPVSFRRKTHGPVNRSSGESESEEEIVRKGDVPPRGLNSKAAAKGLVTDYSEPWNLFALAINSPPSRYLAGSCGQGPTEIEMGVPWRVAYAAATNHYYFDEAGRENVDDVHGRSSGADLPGAETETGHGENYRNYRRLSSRYMWL